LTDDVVVFPIICNSQWLWEISRAGIHKKNRNCERMNRAWPFRRCRWVLGDLLGEFAGRSTCEGEEFHLLSSVFG
jgi:hypothetical protein